MLAPSAKNAAEDAFAAENPRGDDGRQRQLHRLRHVISRLAALVPAGSSDAPEVEELAGYGCVTKMHVVRLLAPRLDHEDHTKDVDFSPTGIRKRWNAGYRDTLATLKQRPWRADSDPLEGFILHEAIGGEVVL